MQRRSMGCFLTLAVFVTLAHAAPPRQMATLSPFKEAPKIDGVLSPGEWDEGALSVLGTQNIRYFGPLDPRYARSYIGFTPEALYLAVETELPPDATLIQRFKARDFYNSGDDSIEIWIDPNRDTRATGEGDRSYIHFMGNFAGIISDARFDPDRGAPDLGWNGHWQFKNTVDKERGTWVAELSIPFKDFGWDPGTAVGRSIGIIVGRNWKRPGGQMTAFQWRGAYADVGFYPQFFLTKDAPSVQVTELGELSEGKFNLQMRLYNPAAQPRRVEVATKVDSSDTPSVKDTKILEIPAGGTKLYKWRPFTLHVEAQHKLQVLARSPEGERREYFLWNVNWTKMRDAKWHIRSRDQAQPGLAVRFAYYPSYRLLKTFINTDYLEKEADKIKTGVVRVTDEAGKELLNQKMRWERVPTEQRFPLPPLPTGEYTLTVTLDGYKEPFVRKFQRKVFPFEGNTLGITEEVFPPFEPVRLEDRTVQVVLRMLRAGGLGLWESIRARGNETAYKELLAAPITVRVNDGETLKGEGKFTTVKDNEVIYDGVAKHPAVTVRTRCRTEFDGCTKVTMSLDPAPQGADLHRLWVDIPLRDDMVSLWHAAITKPRINPAGSVPAGDGVIWDSRRLPNPDFYGNFVPYIWLGGAERGLCWFADNDKDWEIAVDEKNPENSVPCLVLSRKDGILNLRVNLIQQRVMLARRRVIVFGLQPTPSKPMPENWRNIWFEARYPGYRRISWMGAQYWGSDSDFYNKYPRNGDMSILNAMRDARLGKRINIGEFNRAWTTRNLQGVPEEHWSPYTKLNQVTIHTGMRAGDWLTVYWEVFWATSAAHPEARLFQCEWSGRPWVNYPELVYKKRREANVGGTGTLTDSYQDFACWYASEFVHRGIGLYFDNCYPTMAVDPITTEAYQLPDGRIQPSATMWRRRAYFRRIWTLHRQLGPIEIKPIIMHHMTNTHIVPFQTWSDSNLDLEWFYGPEPQQSKYAADLLRAESLGLQTGAMPLVLAHVQSTRTPEEKKMGYRTRFGTMMTHEIRTVYWAEDERKLLQEMMNFGYGKPGCRVFNYWDEDNPVGVSNDQVKRLLLKHDDHLMLLLATWNPKPETVTVTLDAKALGVGLVPALDAETGTVVDLQGNSLKLPLKGYGVRLLTFGKRPEQE